MYEVFDGGGEVFGFVDFADFVVGADFVADENVFGVF